MQNTNFKPNIHYNRDLEHALIGALLLEPETILKITGLIEPNMLYFKDNQTTLEIIIDMWNKGLKIDLLTVNHEVFARNKQTDFPLANPPYELTLKTNLVASTANIEQHALYLRQLAIKRKNLEIRIRAINESEDELETAEKLKDDLNDLLTLKSTDDWQDLSQVMIELDRHRTQVKDREMLGIPTGFRELDQLTYGWQAGQLIVIGARPSVGKSAFVSGMAINAAQHRQTVGIINLEMPEAQIGARLVSFYSDTEFWRIYRNKHADTAGEMKVAQAMSDITGLPIFISDKTNVTIPDIRAKAMKLKKRSGLNLLIIDYLQLIETDGNRKDTREREVAKMSRGLKLLAMDLKIPVVILCQLNRESEKASDKRPHLHNIRESGAIEQDADLVMLIHREFRSGQTTNSAGETTENEAEIIIEKHRNGKCKTIIVGFDPERMRFYDKEAEREYLQPVNYRDYSEPNQEPF